MIDLVEAFFTPSLSGSEAYRNIVHERGLRRSQFDEPTQHLGHEFDMGGVAFNIYSGDKMQSNTIARPDFLNERERLSPGSDSQTTDQEMEEADESSEWQPRWRRQRRRRRQRKVWKERMHTHL